MFDDPVQPVLPVRAVLAANLRRRVSLTQLWTWLGFARQVARRRAAKAPPTPGQPAEHTPTSGHSLDIEV
jgi:hypothetical protein